VISLVGGGFVGWFGVWGFGDGVVVGVGGCWGIFGGVFVYCCVVYRPYKTDEQSGE